MSTVDRLVDRLVVSLVHGINSTSNYRSCGFIQVLHPVPLTGISSARAGCVIQELVLCLLTVFLPSVTKI